MKVAVLVYEVASRTYEVEVPDGLRGNALRMAIDDTDAGTWKHIEEWDEAPEWDGAREPVAAHAFAANGDTEEENLLEEPK